MTQKIKKHCEFGTESDFENLCQYDRLFKKYF